MGVIREFVGPKSKYDETLPYTYEARVKVLNGEKGEGVMNYYYADTLCGLVEYMTECRIRSSEVKMYAIYKEREVLIDQKPLLAKDGNWLKRPILCRSLEDHYTKTCIDHYKGHKEKGECSFIDRDRTVT